MHFTTEWRVPVGLTHSINWVFVYPWCISTSKRSFIRLEMRKKSVMKRGDSVTLSVFSIAKLLRFYWPHAANTNGLACLNSKMSILQPTVPSSVTDLCQRKGGYKWRGSEWAQKNSEGAAASPGAQAAQGQTAKLRGWSPWNGMIPRNSADILPSLCLFFLLFLKQWWQR